jgi:hypothetical protein
MKRFSLLFIVLLVTASAYAQKIDGQWRGYFDSKGDIVTAAGDNTEYVLEINIDGTDITGYSYSYFQDRQYYVICSLSGTYNKADQTMLITETARIKGLTPPGWGDCLQTHFLKYEKIKGKEQLVGKWKAAIGQGNCGSGSTTLVRKTLNKNLAGYNKGRTHMTITKPGVATAKAAPKAKTSETIIRRVVPADLQTIDTSVIDKDLEENDSVVQEMPFEAKSIAQPVLLPELTYEKRTNTLLKTIEIGSDSFQVDLYDSGDIDGDSISLFYNGKLLLYHQRLDVKPITLILDANSGGGENELVMYAETLGTIPPNTALMVVRDGSNRYEVYMTSDLEKSGAVRFVHKKKDTASQ